MKKQMRVSKSVDALRLPTSFIIECMANAEAKPQYEGQIDVQTYAHQSGQKLCIAAFENEILAFTESEIASGDWLQMGRNETMGIADVRKLWNYLRGPAT
jgi:hypothetical protein